MKSSRFLFWLLFFCLSNTAFSQQNQDSNTLKSPYDAVFTHLHHLQADHYNPEKAATPIYGFEDNTQAIATAIKIKQVLDGKGLFVRMKTIPTDSMYIDSMSMRAVYYLFPKKLPEVYVEKQGLQWYYSQETIDAIDDLHSQIFPYGSHLLVNLFPKLGQQRFLGLAIWQYLGMAILLFLSLIFFKIFEWIFRLFIRFFYSSKYKELVDKTLFKRIARALSLLVISYFLFQFVPALLLPIKLSAFLLMAIRISSIVFGVILALRIIDLFMLYSRRLVDRTSSTMDNQLLPVLERMLKIIIIIAGIIQMLRVLDVNITALIAGVSIGGLAIALAAQDTVKNLIGSAMIFIDRPFQIGDYIKAGGVAGVVEEVGFRTTRLRGTDTSIFAVPNGKLADMVINNLGMRAYRQFKIDIGIAYNTPPDRIELFVEGIRKILSMKTTIKEDSAEVHFTELRESSLNIMIATYFEVDNWNAELTAKQHFLLSVLRLAALLNIQFAFPSSSLYIEHFPGKEQPLNKTLDEEALSKALDQFFNDLDQELTSA